MQTLQELTGCESGIVIYTGGDTQAEAVVCNWTSVQGFPRIDPLGLKVLGFGEEIPEVDPETTDDIPSMLKNVEIVFANDEDMPQSGSVYRFEDLDIIVITPEGWC